MAAGLTISTLTAGQCPPSPVERTWRVVPILEAEVGSAYVGAGYVIGQRGGATGAGTLAINDDGLMVGTYLKEVSDDVWRPRPFIWLTTASYGLSPGFYDLLSLFGGGTEEAGYANDVTDDGLVVGGRGGEYLDDGLYAFAWNMPGNTMNPVQVNKPLDDPDSEAVSWSIALAVERVGGQDPRIVGACGLPTCPGDMRPASFRLGQNPVYSLTPVQPDPATGSTWLSSHEIYFTDVADNQPLAMSYQMPSTTSVDQCAGDNAGTSCTGDFQVGALATGVGSPIWLRREEFASDEVAAQTTYARGIDETGFVPGSYNVPDPEVDCVRRPAFWEDATSPVAYVDPVPPLPLPSPVTEGTAEGSLPMCDHHRVVGWTLTALAPEALAWDQCSDGSWCVHKVDEVNVNEALAAVHAYDTNQLGHIAVIVAASPLLPGSPTTCSASQNFYAGVVTAIADLNGDFRVSAADLGILLGAWGSQTVCVVESADLDEDQAVGASDLAILLGAWSNAPVAIAWPCSGLDGCGASAMEQQSEASSLEAGNAAAAAAAAMGFASIEALSAWCESAGPTERQAVLEELLALLEAQEGG